APAPGDHFIIVNNDDADPVSGTFAGLPEGGVFSVGGAHFSITYQGGDGNDVVLTFLADTTNALASSVNPSVYGQSVTFTATVTSRTYGDANPAFPYTITGFVNGEALGSSGVSGSAALSTTATAASPVSTYPITAAVGTLAASNYDFTTFLSGTLTVNPRALA